MCAFFGPKNGDFQKMLRIIWNGKKCNKIKKEFQIFVSIEYSWIVLFLVLFILGIGKINTTIPLSSIYAVSIYAKFYLHGIWVWSHSSVYALISPLFTRFWVKIHSIILFTRFSIYVVFPGKQKTRKRRRDQMYIPDHFCIFSFQVMLWWTIPSSSTVNWNTVKTEVAIQLTQWSYI